MTPGKYKFTSDDSIYEVEVITAVSRLENGRKKRQTDWWARCVKATTKPPGEKFKITNVLHLWERMARVSYLIKINDEEN